MENTIARLWYAGFDSPRKLGAQMQDLKELERRITNAYETLAAKLDGSALELFENYTNGIRRYQMISREQAFSDGFGLGVNITVDALAAATQFLEMFVCQ